MQQDLSTKNSVLKIWKKPTVTVGSCALASYYPLHSGADSVVYGGQQFYSS